MKLYHNLIDGFARTRVGGWLFLRLVSPLDQRLIPLTNGKLNSGLGTDFYDKIVLLRCTGARSGEPRVVPVLVTPLNGHFVLAASAAGDQKNPAWYYNLKANPECSLFVRGRGETAFTAREAEGEEREQALAAANALYSDLITSYQDRVERQIPIMILSPVSGQ